MSHRPFISSLLLDSLGVPFQARGSRKTCVALTALKRHHGLVGMLRQLVPPQWTVRAKFFGAQVTLVLLCVSFLVLAKWLLVFEALVTYVAFDFHSARLFVVQGSISFAEYCAAFGAGVPFVLFHLTPCLVSFLIPLLKINSEIQNVLWTVSPDTINS